MHFSDRRCQTRPNFERGEMGGQKNHSSPCRVMAIKLFESFELRQ